MSETEWNHTTGKQERKFKFTIVFGRWFIRILDQFCTNERYSSDVRDQMQFATRISEKLNEGKNTDYKKQLAPQW